MPQIQVDVLHKVGLHARPASSFVKLAATFPCNISVRNISADNDRVANAKSILSVLTLGVQQGHTIGIQADGPDADEALKSLEKLVIDNFGEQ